MYGQNELECMPLEVANTLADEIGVESDVFVNCYYPSSL